jgi:phasin family protein
MQVGGTEQPLRQEHDMSNKTKTTTAFDTGNAAVADIAGQTRAKLNDGIEKAMKTAEGLATFGQGNIDALTKSTLIWAAGVQDLSKQVAASFQASIQETLGVLKTLGTAKSLKEAIDLQSAVARTALEKAMSESSRFTQASLKLTEQALVPLTARISAAAPAFGKTA